MRRSLVLVDSQGFTRSILLTTNGGASSIQAVLLAVSDADYADWWESALTINAAPSPVNAQYNSVKDYAVLYFATAGTSLISITLPAPQVSIFFADQETVNPAAIASLISAVVGTAVDSGGNVATAFVAGKL